VADEVSLTAELGEAGAPRSPTVSDTTETDEEHSDREQPEVGSEWGKLATCVRAILWNAPVGWVIDAANAMPNPL
jgi:hypothetical protein